MTIGFALEVAGAPMLAAFLSLVVEFVEAIPMVLASYLVDKKGWRKSP